MNINFLITEPDDVIGHVPHQNLRWQKPLHELLPVVVPGVRHGAVELQLLRDQRKDLLCRDLVGGRCDHLFLQEIRQVLRLPDLLFFLLHHLLLLMLLGLREELDEHHLLALEVHLDDVPLHFEFDQHLVPVEDLRVLVPDQVLVDPLLVDRQPFAVVGRNELKKLNQLPLLLRVLRLVLQKPRQKMQQVPPHADVVIVALDNLAYQLIVKKPVVVVIQFGAIRLPLRSV